MSKEDVDKEKLHKIILETEIVHMVFNDKEGKTIAHLAGNLEFMSNLLEKLIVASQELIDKFEKKGK